MNFFPKLFTTTRREVVQDELFGELQLTTGKDKNSFWSGKCIFKPIDKQVHLTIHTTQNVLPSSEQKIFYKKVENEYDLLSKKWRMALENVLKNADENMKVEKLESMFTLKYLQIPRNFTSSTEWEVSFDIIPEIDRDHTFTVLMKGWETEGVAIDG